MGKLRIAIAQIRSHKNDVLHDTKRAKEMIERASELDADYLAFPELFLSGHSAPSPVEDASEWAGDPAFIQEIGEHAGRLGVGVVMGQVESDGSALYNGAVMIDKNGRILGSYRKIHLLDHERKVFTPGKELPVFELPGVKAGIMIGHDMEYPETARILAIRGIQLLFVLSASTFSDRQRHTINLRGRAMENHLFLVVANKVGLEEDQLFFGESKWIHPNGTILYTCSHNEEITVREIDLSEIEQTRGTLDYLENRRPQMYEKEWK